MTPIRKDKTADKRLLQLEDWSDTTTNRPFVVATTVLTKPTFCRRVAFAFKTIEEATSAFDALVLGKKTPKDFVRNITDQFLAQYL